jgi:hypothetical protein
MAGQPKMQHSSAVRHMHGVCVCCKRGWLRLLEGAREGRTEQAASHCGEMMTCVPFVSMARG